MSAKKENNIQEEPMTKASHVEDPDDTIAVPVAGIFRQLRKYLLIWIITAVVFAGLIFSGSLWSASSSATPLTAMVGFYYDGIEQGLDPNGDEFDANSIRSIVVIQSTLSELGFSDSLAETIRSNITISGIVDSDTIDKLTAYESIFESNNSIEAAQRILDTSYYPTTFEIQFNYSSTGFSRIQAAEFLNTMLSNYKDYFMDTYGTNDSFGTSLSAIDYSEYDYAQTIDVFSSTLTSLKSYIDDLSNQSNAEDFRSSSLGYSFSDLSSSVSTLQSVDLSNLSSYVISNNITKNKSDLVSYYEYRIEELTRSLEKAQDRLDSIKESIENYEKDTYVVVAGSDGTSSSALTEPSEAYDDLITQKTSAQNTVSNYQSQINDYTSRLEKLNKGSVGTSAEQEEAETRIDTLCEKINTLIEDTNTTSDEYYEKVARTDSYSVLVPASGSTSSAVSNAISDMKRPLLIAEAMLIVIYIAFAVIRAFMVSYRKEKRLATEGKPAAKEDEATSENEGTTQKD